MHFYERALTWKSCIVEKKTRWQSKDPITWHCSKLSRPAGRVQWRSALIHPFPNSLARRKIRQCGAVKKRKHLAGGVWTFVLPPFQVSLKPVKTHHPPHFFPPVIVDLVSLVVGRQSFWGRWVHLLFTDRYHLKPWNLRANEHLCSISSFWSFNLCCSGVYFFWVHHARQHSIHTLENKCLCVCACVVLQTKAGRNGL